MTASPAPLPPAPLPPAPIPPPVSSSNLPAWIGYVLGGLASFYGYLNTSGALTNLSPKTGAVITSIGGAILLLSHVWQQYQTHAIATNTNAIAAVSHPQAAAAVAATIKGA